jgi:hypothetical protein
MPSPFDLDSGSALDLDEIEEAELGPPPREQSTPFSEGAGVDEVEYAYGYGLVPDFEIWRLTSL